MIKTYIGLPMGPVKLTSHLLTHLILQQPHKVDTIIIPILQIRKLRPKR